MKIGLMDSGMGGLTVLKELWRHHSDHEYYYYADSDNAPYGTKTPELVTELTEKAVATLVACGVEVIIIACNTATIAAANGLRTKYDIPIIGMLPEIADAIAAAGPNKRVLVTATKLTLTQPTVLNLVRELDGAAQVDMIQLSELVAFAEAGQFGAPEPRALLKEKFAHINPKTYGSIILGCTHFPLFKPLFEEIFPEDVEYIDGAKQTRFRLEEILSAPSDNPGITFFVSGTLVTAGPRYDLIQKIINMEGDL